MRPSASSAGGRVPALPLGRPRVAQVLPAAAAASAEHRAARRRARGTRLEQRLDLTAREARPHLDQAHAHAIARSREGHEDDPAVRRAPDPVAARGQGVDAQLDALRRTSCSRRSRHPRECSSTKVAEAWPYTPGSMRPPRFARLSLALLGLAGAGLASAQGLHPFPLGALPLHLRMAEADAIAIGTVEAIGDGRIRVRDATALRGAPGETFEIKRAPSKPPPLAVGQQAVFLLRGARPPYVLVGDPKEVVSLRDAESARAWRDALAKLLAASDDPEKLLAVYVTWLDGADETRRASAAAALVDTRSKLPGLAEDAAIERARVALDGARPI